MADPHLRAEALWYSAPQRAEIRAETLPASLGPGELRVRARHGAISRGTEALVFAGRVPPSEYARMRAPAMAGTFPFPVKYGYATVGTVEAGPPEWIGRSVFCLVPHQTVFTIDADAAIAVTDAVPPRRAVLAANMETALNALWDAAPGPADRIAVIGAGVVGALVAWLGGRLPGAEVTLVDIDASRQKVAQALGVRFALPEAAPQECDVVFHASATAAGLGTALRAAGVEATVLELSWYGAAEIPVALGAEFHSKRLKLLSSQVGLVAPSHRARWTHQRRLAAALALLAEPCFDALLEPAISFHDLPDRLPSILDHGSGILCQVIDYPPAPQHPSEA